jgi:hypothetical protein
MIASTNSFSLPATDSLQARFLELLPRIETHARISFRHVPCPDRKQECVQEVIALSWKWFVTLAQRGKDAADFIGALATLAVRAVRSGRRAYGQEKANDAMSEQAQRRHGFTVERLPISASATHEELYGDPHGQRRHDAWEERLRDNTVTPPDEQAAFRIDFVAWLKSLTPRERRLVRAMTRNESTKDLAREFHLSPGRISQLRREFHADWTRFCGDRLDEKEQPLLAVA